MASAVGAQWPPPWLSAWLHWPRHPWAGSRKSREGTLAAWLSMALSTHLVWAVLDGARGFCWSLRWPNWPVLWIGAGLVAFLEAMTDQVDNLTLPLVHCTVLCAMVQLRAAASPEELLYA
jgi:dolichol kinase